tara:strand:- start:3081 stop:3458 length:378 start_codon:yes stop_codon:yes gene_type:complete
MKRTERLILNSKTSNTFEDKILSRSPVLSDLKEGQIIIRNLPQGLYLFTKYNNILYSARLKKQNVEVLSQNVKNITNNTGGTEDGVLAAISGSGADSDINNNFTELSSKINSILSKLSEIIGKIN